MVYSPALMPRLAYTVALSHAQWQMIKPLFKSEKATSRMIDLFHKVRTWRELLGDFQGQTVYNKYFHCWQRNRMWAEMKRSLLRKLHVQVGKSSTISAAIVDSHSAKTMKKTRASALGSVSSKRVSRHGNWRWQCPHLLQLAWRFMVLMTLKLFNLRCLHLQVALHPQVSAIVKSKRGARLALISSLIETVYLLICSESQMLHFCFCTSIGVR